ncbi:DUF2190 family protein [Chitinibacter sp. GC72]|uniref:DUF2190 family protein n=1 Tax=Chitinibacter sp. GC72 TaxID=1526917 RepID=UPI0012FA0631|nr:DUF2190 family protein [Chitinibacter sp. GC72]
MKNFIQPGAVITLLAPAALASGDAVLVGSVFGVAATAAANGAPVEVKREGVFTLPALNTDTATVGAKAYWDNTNKRTTPTASGNTLIGAYVAAKSSGDTTAAVLLDGTIR